MTCATTRIDSAGVHFGVVLGTRTFDRFVLRRSRYVPSLQAPLHDHADPYFSWVCAGMLFERGPRGAATHAAGSLHFHPGADPHDAATGDHGLTCLSVTPRGRLARRLDARLSPHHRLSPALERLAARCDREFGADDAASDLALEGLALELFAEALRRPEPVRGAAPRWLARVRERLHASLDQRVSLTELAATAGVHPAHLARAFRRHVGCPPATYLRRLRLERARGALESTDDPIAAIALEAGCSSQAHFTRLFHAHVGLPPAAFRRRSRVLESDKTSRA